ncbi:MAG: zinc-finger-containing protein [Allosphingosinicella sp.]
MARARRARSVLLCPYCDEPAELVPAIAIYPRRADLSNRQFWRCRPCGAWVGCHEGTERPLGRLANAELRQAKQDAHAAFDPLWKRKMEREGCSKGKARGAGYKWLAEQLGIERKRCHIGMLSVAECRRVVEVCARRKG